MNAMLRKRLAGIPRHPVLVHDVQHAEVAGPDDEASAVHGGPELHRVRVHLLGLAAEADDLPEVQPGPVDLRRLRAALLQLEVLDRAAQPVEGRQRPLGDDLRDEVRLSAGPEPGTEEERGAPREAPLVSRQQRVRAAVQVGVRRGEGQLPAGDVRRLPVGVPPLVLEVVEPGPRQHVHHVERDVLVPTGGAAWPRTGEPPSAATRRHGARSRRAARHRPGRRGTPAVTPPLRGCGTGVRRGGATEMSNEEETTRATLWQRSGA